MAHRPKAGSTRRLLQRSGRSWRRIRYREGTGIRTDGQLKPRNHAYGISDRNTHQSIRHIMTQALER